MGHGSYVSALQFFTGHFQDYWHILYKETPKHEFDCDRYMYFYDISPKAILNEHPLDPSEVYLFYGYDKKYHYHALEIAQYALACWLTWRKTKLQKWLVRAVSNCEWLLNNQASTGEWKIYHKNPRYADLDLPWVSGMAQGLAISALIRYYIYSKDDKILESCDKAINVLERDVCKGGVKRCFEGNFIYEEYPLKKINGVLNGYISAVNSIIEMSKISNEYFDLKLKNIQNLRNILKYYDTSFWSLYSLDGNIASGFYHRYHVIQLKSLGFEDYAFKFEKYTKDMYCKTKAFFMKIKNENYTNNFHKE